MAMPFHVIMEVMEQLMLLQVEELEHILLVGLLMMVMEFRMELRINLD